MRQPINRLGPRCDRSIMLLLRAQSSTNYLNVCNQQRKRKISRENLRKRPQMHLCQLIIILIILCTLGSIHAIGKQPQILNNQHSPQTFSKSLAQETSIDRQQLVLEPEIIKFDDEQDEYYLGNSSILYKIINRKTNKPYKIRQSIKSLTNGSSLAIQDELITAGDSSTSKYLSRLGAARYRYRPQVHATLDSRDDTTSGSDASSNSKHSISLMNLVDGSLNTYGSDHDQVSKQPFAYNSDTEDQDFGSVRSDNSRLSIARQFADSPNSNNLMTTKNFMVISSPGGLYHKQTADEIDNISNNYSDNNNNNNNIDESQQPTYFFAPNWRRKNEQLVHRPHHTSANQHNNNDNDNSNRNRNNSNNRKKNRTHDKLQIRQPSFIGKDVSVRSELLLIQNNNNSTIVGLERRNLSGSADGPAHMKLPSLSSVTLKHSPMQADKQQVVHLSANSNTNKRLPPIASRFFIDLDDAPAAFSIAQPVDHQQDAAYQLATNGQDDSSSLAENRGSDDQNSTLISFDFSGKRDNEALSKLDNHYRLNSATDYEDHSADEPLNLGERYIPYGSIRSHNLLRTSSTSSEIRVLEPNSTGLVINQRGLIMAAKKTGNRHPTPGRPYNASALFTNHLDHSLSPVRVTPAVPMPSGGDSRPSFLQRNPMISSVIWRNQSRPTEAPAYELIGDAPPFLVVPNYIRFNTNKTNPNTNSYAYGASLPNRRHSSNWTESATGRPSLAATITTTTITTTTSTTTSTPPPNTETSNTSGNSLDGRTQVAASNSTNNQPQFHHNPPYKQHLHSAQLDMASTQQLVAEFDNKNNLNRLQKHKHNPVTKEVTTRAPNKFQPHHSSYEPPFEMSTTISNQLNTLTNSHSNNNSNSNSTGPNRPPQNNNHKLMNKLQHMLIGKILKNQSFNNLTSQASPTSPPSYSNSATTTPYTPAPLLSSTVANNVANLIAQKLNSLFVKPILNSGSSGSSGTSSSSSSSNGLGLSSLFGYRVTQSNTQPNRIKQRVNPFMTVTHTPVNRRTAGVGSLLVSGLIYGLSVLPALMALTGINPLSSTDSSPASSNLVANRQAGPSAKYQSKSTRKPTNLNLQEAYTYLVPVIPTVSNALDDELFNESEAQQSALKSLYSPPPTIIEPSESVQLYDSHPLQATMGEFTSEHPLDIFQPPISTEPPINHPYARYKGHLYYSQPFAPVSTNVWPASANIVHEPNHIIWQQTQRNIHNPVSKARRDTLTASRSQRSPTYAKEIAVGRPSTPKLPNPSSSSLNSTSVLGRSYRVGYTINYKPVNYASTMNPLSPHQSKRAQKFIEFQDVDDVTSGALSARWKPVTHTRNRAKYNLNRGFKKNPSRHKIVNDRKHSLDQRNIDNDYSKYDERSTM